MPLSTIIYASFGIRIIANEINYASFGIQINKIYLQQTNKVQKYQFGRSAIKYYIQNKTTIVRCPHAGSSNYLWDIH